ncbi:MAG: hypothetical protein J7647_11640 [Cyanobacteria bacterium SBLK]|nr:hypothetical protein [Cyanobacteria bacterium SBLK]
MIDALLDRIGDWNPQLLRELKGRLTSKNILISGGVSLAVQVAFYFGFSGNHYSRNFPSWVLPLFITLSIISIIILLVGGVYILIDDLQREEKRGTLNFIRLSPQTSRSILLGKILGVPILIYLGIFLAAPLHFGLGIYAAIPVHLIFSFYTIVTVNCFLFYSAALLFALVSYSHKLKASLAFSGSVLVFIFILLFVLIFSSPNFPFPIGAFNWLSFFYPGYFIHFLLSQTPHSSDWFNYSSAYLLKKITWFGLPFWSNAIAAFLFTIANYFIVISWLWHGLNRRFHDREISPIGKGQSYWSGSILTVVLIGFSSQSNNIYDLSVNFLVLIIIQFFLYFVLILALSPRRKTLQTWSRYRHQIARKNLFSELLWGEKSPATLAIALNLILGSTISLIAFFLLPFGEYRSSLIAILLIGNGVILLYASLVQWIFLQKIKQPIVVALSVLMTLSSLPSALTILPDVALFKPALLITSMFPIFSVYGSTISPTIFLSLIGQGIAIAAINIQMTRQLQHLGESEMKELLSVNSHSQT